MEKHKIAIPEPCHENWNTMTAGETGRFCGSCSKNVIDFTKMLPDEIQKYFAAHQQQRICGRFATTQLEHIRILIPEKLLFSQTRFHHKFLLALILAMGTTILSCADENGTKKKIEAVEITPENNTTPERYLHTIGIAYNPPDFLVMEPETYILLSTVGLEPADYVPQSPPAPSIDEVKFVKIKKTGSKNSIGDTADGIISPTEQDNQP